MYPRGWEVPHHPPPAPLPLTAPTLTHVPGAAPATFLPLQTLGRSWAMRPSAGESRCLSSSASSWGSLFASSWPSWQGRCKVPELGTEVGPDSAPRGMCRVTPLTSSNKQ